MKREFTTPVSMVVNANNYFGLLETLKSYGYKHGNFQVSSEQNLIVTNSDGVSDKMHITISSISDDMGRHFIKEFNRDLFLALAAMSAGDDIYPGEWVLVKKDISGVMTLKEGQIVKSGGLFDHEALEVYDTDGQSAVGPLSYFRKATKAELIKHFFEKKLVSKYSNAKISDDSLKEKDLPEKVEVKFSFADKSRDYNAHIDSRSTSGNIELIKKLVDSTGVLGPKGATAISTDDKTKSQIMLNYIESIRKEGDMLRDTLISQFETCTAIGEHIRASGTTHIKPPLGIMPRKIWEERRITGLMDSIESHIKANQLIPEEWIDELSSLLYDRIKPTE